MNALRAVANGSTLQADNQVDNTDWLKAVAIILVVIDHIGYFFIDNADWWSVLGRGAAPIFFFLMGYANTRSVPTHWLWLAAALTGLDSWNNDWGWVAPNILLSFVLVRLARPGILLLIERYGVMAWTGLLVALLVGLPFMGSFVEYGTEGWLWALFGISQRRYTDARLATEATRSAVGGPGALMSSTAMLRLAICIVAAGACLFEEQREFMFSEVHLAAFWLIIIALAFCLCRFRRGPSPLQPTGLTARAVRFLGRHTLEIYAIQLAGSELLVGFVPAIAA